MDNQQQNTSGTKPENDVQKHPKKHTLRQRVVPLVIKPDADAYIREKIALNTVQNWYNETKRAIRNKNRNSFVTNFQILVTKIALILDGVMDAPRMLQTDEDGKSLSGNPSVAIEYMCWMLLGKNDLQRDLRFTNGQANDQKHKLEEEVKREIVIMVRDYNYMIDYLIDTLKTPSLAEVKIDNVDYLLSMEPEEVPNYEPVPVEQEEPIFERNVMPSSAQVQEGKDTFSVEMLDGDGFLTQTGLFGFGKGKRFLNFVINATYVGGKKIKSIKAYIRQKNGEHPSIKLNEGRNTIKLDDELYDCSVVRVTVEIEVSTGFTTSKKMKCTVEKQFE